MIESGKPPPELCVVLAATGEAAEARRLAGALAAVPVACVILKPVGEEALDAARVGPLVALAQDKGVAAVLWADAALARTLKADGVHLPWTRTLAADYATAREILDSRAIVGGDAGRSRHDAMALGEAGASYVGFGAPLALKDLDTARARRAELIAWWAEIFEVPCLALDVEDRAAAAALAAAGADFLAVDIAGDDDGARLRDIHAAATATARV